MKQYDAIVIGSGQAGGPLSTALAQAGYKTAIIERVHVGGTCINEGCTPTKTMVASGRVAYLTRRAADYGVEAGPVSVDMKVVRKRKRDIVDSFRTGSERRIVGAEGDNLLMGEARFIEPKVVEVRLNTGEIDILTANTFFINAGDRPSIPPIDGIKNVPTLDSTSIMELDSVPEHLLVFGGSYIALEFGQMFRRFGSKVTIIQRSAHLLSREDTDIADEVAQILREDGLEILLESSVLHVSQNLNGSIEMLVRTAGGEQILTGSHLLVAAGRVPNTDWLNLEAAGIETDKRGFIHVNDRLETNVPGVYALGDIKGGPAFTHISYDDFRIIRTNLLEHGNASIRDRLVPYTVFIDPQLGRIGLSESEARASGRAIRVAKMPMNYVARALELDESRGFMKAIVDAESGQILGGAVLGIEGGEIMAMLEIAMMGKLPYTALRDAVFAHPTLAESLNNLFTMFEQ
ncbi:MAG TPA: mercuric reductase [Ktedonobacteraceae bacterium]|nr:mercuric reductase [Ktedonobacteraceae bacterium]